MSTSGIPGLEKANLSAFMTAADVAVSSLVASMYLEK